MDNPTNAAVTALSLSHVSYSYDGSNTALSDISLTVASGERLAILGANGSGKSTLLKILDGLVHPTAGRFLAFGEEITARALRDEEASHRFRRRIGFVFQNSEAQLFSATVREEIAFGPLQMGLPPGEVERRIADVAGLLGIEPLLDRPPFQLSGGEKKKVAVASVLVMGPEAILLDEPTGGLDPRTKSWLAAFLEDLHRAGKTLVSATNDLDWVPAVGDRVVVLNENHAVEADGPAREILADTRLLRAVNVVHDHAHWHDGRLHAHPHFHGGDHEHEHTP